MTKRRRFTAKFKVREGLDEVFERRAPGVARHKADAETQALHAKIGQRVVERDFLRKRSVAESAAAPSLRR